VAVHDGVQWQVSRRRPGCRAGLPVGRGDGGDPAVSVTIINSMPTSPAGSSSRNPPAFANEGVSPPRYQGCVGNHVVSNASLLGFRVVQWITAIGRCCQRALRGTASAAGMSMSAHPMRVRRAEELIDTLYGAARAHPLPAELFAAPRGTGRHLPTPCR
jgi:hypothetical protein